MNKNLRRFTAGLLAIALSFTMFCSNTFALDTQTQTEAQTQNKQEIPDIQYLESIKNFIRQKYSGNIDAGALDKNSVTELFGALDQYTGFYTLQEFNSFYKTFEAQVEGVGIHVQVIDKYITIIRVIANSPAQKVGLLSGDKIAQVNGESVVGKPLEDVIGKIKGTVGTKVKLGINRQKVSKMLTYEIARAKMTVPSVSYEIRDNIGYISIDTFTASTKSGVDQAIKNFDSSKITKVVLDLRNNPGGLVDQAVAVARYFVPQGLITRLDYKDESVEDESFYSTLTNNKYRLAVLVNDKSASASEILTGAIRDTKAGIVVGTKTFGKAKVQGFFPILKQDSFERLNANKEFKTVNAMEFGNALETDILGWSKMTIGLYYTPKGECIDLKGIEPNVKVDEGNAADSIPVNMIDPLGLTVKPSLGTQYMDVYIAEHILKLLNYKVDTPDMKFDKKTFAAISKFQKDSKVYSYGVLDFCTQKLLNAKLQTLKKSKDKVYAKAITLLK